MEKSNMYITNYIFQCDDIIIREYAANILRLLTKNHIIGKVFIKEDVMNKMFFILTNEPDIDILNNTLGIICNTMDLVMAPTAVETYKKFDLNVIECFIESCGIDLAATASLILLKIAKWRELDIQPFILDTGIMNVILPLILVSQFTVCSVIVLIKNIVLLGHETN